MRKISGTIVAILIFLAVLILVYVFIKKGFSGTGGSANISQMTTVATSNLDEIQTPVQTTSPAVSNKISLIVSTPDDGSTLSSTAVTVKGKTTPNADVFVNDQTGKADANGNFSIGVTLDEGNNQIVVSANDTVGNATEQDLNVTVSSFQ